MSTHSELILGAGLGEYIRVVEGLEPRSLQANQMIEESTHRLTDAKSPQSLRVDVDEDLADTSFLEDGVASENPMLLSLDRGSRALASDEQAG